MKVLPFNKASIESIQLGQVGYVGKVDYDAMIRVFEPEGGTCFRHRCWFGHVVFYGDAQDIIEKANADGTTPENGVVIIVDDDDYPGRRWERLAEAVNCRQLRTH